MLNILTVLAQSYNYDYSSTASSPADTGASLAVLGVMFLVYIPIIVLMVAAMWKLFTKAGKPGWAALVPIYSTIVSLEMVGMPLWWLAIAIFIGPVYMVFFCINLAKSFGKDTTYALGLIFLPIIFVPMLAFGKSQYQGPVVAGSTNPM